MNQEQNKKSRSAEPLSPDVTAVLNLHREGFLCAPAIRSYALMCEHARSCGHRVESLAVLDKPDERTRSIVDAFSSVFHQVEVVDFGDLGASRNHGRSLGRGRHVCFLDGDDLWGKTWISRALEFSKTVAGPAVFHPEFVYYFNQSDFPDQSRGAHPSPSARSFFFRHLDSAEPSFDPRCIAFNNIYTSNAFADRDVYERHPYAEVDRARGFGVEDWGWNGETLAAGVRHAVVPDTVHLVRVKESGSLGASNAMAGLLPPLHRIAGRLRAASQHTYVGQETQER